MLRLTLSPPVSAFQDDLKKFAYVGIPPERRTEPGDCPVKRLNARLKAASDW